MAKGKKTKKGKKRGLWPLALLAYLLAVNTAQAIPVTATQMTPEIVVVTADYAVLGFNEVVLVDSTSGSIAVTLPLAALTPTQRITVKKIDVDSNAVTVVPTGNDLVENVTSVTLANGEAVSFQSAGGTH
jgi:hypothetical protein